MYRLIVIAFAGVMNGMAQTASPPLLLPTANHALLDGKPDEFYQFIDRTQDGATMQVWQGGQFGFVRNPVKLNSGETIYTRFHEGLDIKPTQRDAQGEPLDEVHSMAAGEVVHCSDRPGASNYGRYVVVRHDWAEGPFCSLYAHLREIRCSVGQKVAAGDAIGLMGYSGAGIDRRRAHTHVELGLYLSSRFPVWHDHQTASLNYHGMWNGLNLVGLDLGKLLLDRAQNPGISVADFIKNTPAHFSVAVPGNVEMELLQHYPWLCPVPLPAVKPKSWLMTFTAWGLPVKIEPATTEVNEPTIVWVRPATTPQYSLTRGLLNGIGERVRLSGDGLAYVQLASGQFTPKPKAAMPAPSRAPVKKKRSK
jgi:murein DD-endopeptidase MepM/ murein hydrolase activator NlpD